MRRVGIAGLGALLVLLAPAWSSASAACPSQQPPLGLDMAFSLEKNVYPATYAIWPDAVDDERHRSWVHDHRARLATVGEGVYLGDSDFGRRPDRFMTDAHFERFHGIRARRDPDNRFVGYLFDA